MATRLSNEHVAYLEVISHCRNEEEQPLNYRLTSLESEQILAADSQLPLAPLVSTWRRSKIEYTLHLRHAPQCGIVAPFKKRGSCVRLLAPFQKVPENRLHNLHITNGQTSSILPFQNLYLKKQPFAPVISLLIESALEGPVTQAYSIGSMELPLSCPGYSLLL